MLVRKPRLKPGEKVLKAVRPNVGLERDYKRRLTDLIDEMTDSVEWWLTSAYKREKPLVEELAMDEPMPIAGATWVGGARPWAATAGGEQLRTSHGKALRFATEQNAVNAARRFVGERLPADELRAVMQDLGDQWLDRFDEAANRMATYFSRAAAQRTSAQMRAILRQGGISVRFQMTPAIRDIVQASVHENVALIRSIPEQYLKNVEGMVMRSVQRGRDLQQLTRDLRHQYGVTRRRAALIALDQNNKMTSVIHETRRKELGIEEAIWMHSHAGKEPRPTHVAMDGKRYKVSEGMYDSAVKRNVFPGELIRCRCTSRSIIPGFK